MYYTFNVTIGTIAKIVVKDYKVLNDPIIRCVPTVRIIGRMKTDLLTKTDNKALDKHHKRDYTNLSDE